MTDYKSAKEAFVSDNLGASIASINAVSLVALASYALYMSLSPHLSRTSFTLDYLASVLPILLGITLFSTSPIIFTAALTFLSLFFITSARPQLNYSTPSPQNKSKGQWLDESDSDEEPAEPASAGASTTVSPVKLPSQVAFASAYSLSPTSASPVSPSTPSSLGFDDPMASLGLKLKRRLSPIPGSDSFTVDMPTGVDAVGKARESPVPSLRLRRGARGARSGEEKGKLPFLTVYRAHMMLMTVLCILAVDFSVFPRWQGKCEDFGTSLMDVGVGSFVFSLGLISTKSLSPPPPAPIPSSPSMNTYPLASSSPHPITAILASLRKSIPILVLGFIRLLMVKGADYPEHVTEYGVHWNFFFTLALVPVLAVGVRPLTEWVRWSVLGMVITLAQQTVLTHFNLQSFILSTARPNLLAANKEGIASLPGYLAIFLIGVSTGEHVLRLTLPPATRKPVTETQEEHERSHYDRRRTDLALELFGYGVAWWSLLGASRLVGGEVSRRMANTPYVLWVAAYNTTFLFGYLLLELLLPASPSSPLVPPLLDALNKNGLVVFLVANLLTGLVNVSMETMYASRTVGMGVLVGYSVAVCGIAWVLRGKRLKI
ncbi:hypothetical protein IAT38_006571 [Cryptococcus sp. DSM 104549]